MHYAFVQIMPKTAIIFLLITFRSLLMTHLYYTLVLIALLEEDSVSEHCKSGRLSEPTVQRLTERSCIPVLLLLYKKCQCATLERAWNVVMYQCYGVVTGDAAWGYRGGSPTAVQAWRICPLWEPSTIHPILV